MVVRTLTGMTGALAAGLVLGARVPIVVVARNESMESRMASCVLASLLASAKRDGTHPAPSRQGEGTPLGAHTVSRFAA